MKCKILFVFSCFLLTTCATESPELRSKAENIPVASTIGPSDLEKFKEIKSVSCDLDLSIWADQAEEQCRQNLRLESARADADLLVIDSHVTGPCMEKKTCLFVTGHAYKKIAAPRTPEKLGQ